MKLLIINASPRKNGNIAKRLEMMKDEAEHSGASVKVEYAQNWKIRPCIGCMKCRSSKNCVLPEDDSQRVLSLIQECDALIVGTPTYWGNMPGTLKLLFDRIVYGLMDENKLAMPVPLHKGKKALIVCSSSTPWPFNILMGQTSGVVRAIKEVVGTAGFKVSSIQRGGTKNHPEISTKDIKRCRRAVRWLLACFVSLVSLFCPALLPAQTNALDDSSDRVIPVKYSEETELLAVVCHLADIGGYNFNEEDGVLPDYLADVDSYFAPYKEHRAVKFAGRKLYRRGFSYDLPMALALRLSIDDGHLIYNEGLVEDFDGYYERISRSDEKKFIALLEDFYKESSFREFFNSHRKVYRECEKAMRKVVDKFDMGWYDSFFGPIDGVEFCVYLGLLNGPGNFAVHQKLSDGKEKVNALMGCCDRDSDGKIYYGEVYTLPVLVHEFNHSYCNPLNEEIWDGIEERAKAIFSENADFYRSIAYGSPEYIMNEMFVEASMIRYLMSHPLDLSGTRFEGMEELIDRLIMVDDKKKFILVRTMIDVLGRREAEYGAYPTMRDFLPEYVKAVNNIR